MVCSMQFKLVKCGASEIKMARLETSSDLGLSPVYLDCNSTTPLAPEVMGKTTEALRLGWANPSSKHEAGVKARKYVTEARLSVGRMLNCDAEDIIFTSGGTESANIVVHTATKCQTESAPELSKPHIIYTNVEHPCVESMASKMCEDGRLDQTVVAVSTNTGQVNADAIAAAIRPTTVLVSVMLANNETGIIMPVQEIAKELAQYRKAHNSVFPLLHTDASQAIGKIPVDVKELRVDYLSLAGHKFYGPRCGALYVRSLDKPKGAPLHPLMFGAQHERGYRPGTENVGMIAGLGKAAELVADNITVYSSTLAEVRDYLEALLKEAFGGRVHLNSCRPGVPRLPNTCSMSIAGAELHRLKVASKLKCSQVGTGAACLSGVARPSAGLLAAGVPEDIANNTLRVSIGHATTKQDVERFVLDLKQAVKELEGGGADTE